MRASILRRLIVLSVAVTAAAGGPVQARSAAGGHVGVPRWLDQTVYRPDSPLLECDCEFVRRGPE
jgi:hypothetical protein